MFSFATYFYVCEMLQLYNFYISDCYQDILQKFFVELYSLLTFPFRRTLIAAFGAENRAYFDTK